MCFLWFREKDIRHTKSNLGRSRTGSTKSISGHTMADTSLITDVKDYRKGTKVNNIDI